MTHLLLQLRSRVHAAFLTRDDVRGAAVVEYALLLVFIFAILVIAVTVIGETTSTGLEDAGSSGFVGP